MKQTSFFQNVFVLIALQGAASLVHAGQFPCTDPAYVVGPLQFRYVETVVPPLIETEEEGEDLSLLGISVDGDDIIRDDIERYIYDTYPGDHRIKSILYGFPIAWHYLVKSWDETGQGTECFWTQYLTAEAKLRNEIAMDLLPPEAKPKKHEDFDMQAWRAARAEVMPQAIAKADDIIYTMLAKYINTVDRSLGYLRALHSIESRADGEARLAQLVASGSVDDPDKPLGDLPPYLKPWTTTRME